MRCPVRPPRRITTRFAKAGWPAAIGFFTLPTGTVFQSINNRIPMKTEQAFAEMLRIGPRVTVLPVVHGSGDFAWTIRDWILRGNYDCLAVPLPPSFAPMVEAAIGQLPAPGIVVQRESVAFVGSRAESEDADPAASYVPIDPCQPVIAALRTAIGERIPRRFIDLETARFEMDTAGFPDPYALKKVPLPQFAASLLPFLPAPENPQVLARITQMAWMLRELSIDFKNILFVCHALHWPWIRQAFGQSGLQRPDDDLVEPARWYGVEPGTLYFMLGELPFVTGLYEKARAELDPDDNLSIDGIKELLISARVRYQANYQKRARRITPLLLRQMLKYIRNLTLLKRRFTPDLVTVITAAKQIVGDGYALQCLELAKTYPGYSPADEGQVRMGMDQAAMPEGDVLAMKNRLPGPPLTWSQIKLVPGPDRNSRHTLDAKLESVFPVQLAARRRAD